MRIKIKTIHWVVFSTILFAFLTIIGFTLYLKKPTYTVERIPSFSLKMFDGAFVPLENFRGKPMVLSFWAGWCVYCQDEMPTLEKMYQKYKDQGLIIYGVHRSSTEDIKVAQDFAKSVGVTYPLIEDKNDFIYRYFNVVGLPVTIFINKDGFVEDKILGPRTEAQFDVLIKRIMIK